MNHLDIFEKIQCNYCTKYCTMHRGVVVCQLLIILL